MLYAIPVSDGRLSAHFGHCEHFALIEVDDNDQSVGEMNLVDAPPHSPGLLPAWLAEREVNAVIAGGMGGRALQLFQGHGISVVLGAPEVDPTAIVRGYLEGTLVLQENLCDHSHHRPGCDHHHE